MSYFQKRHNHFLYWIFISILTVEMILPASLLADAIPAPQGVGMIQPTAAFAPPVITEFYKGTQYFPRRADVDGILAAMPADGISVVPAEARPAPAQTFIFGRRDVPLRGESARDLLAPAAAAARQDNGAALAQSIGCAGV